MLVLQPTVEAFFLVHAGDKREKKKDADRKREDQLSHLNVDLAPPMSPAGPPAQSATGGSELTQSVSHLSGISRQDSALSSSVISMALPPDTQKFLQFAGMWTVVTALCEPSRSYDPFYSIHVHIFLFIAFYNVHVVCNKTSSARFQTRTARC